MTTKPTIVAVDDDPAVLRAIARDLRARYGADYRIVRAESGAEAIEAMTELKLRDRPVALLVSDQRMPQMTGVELMEQVRGQHPDAKLLLLTAYADTDVAIKAINDIGLDYYMLKPWDPPEERLYPVIDDLLAGWQGDHPEQESQLPSSGTGGPTGPSRSRRSWRTTTSPTSWLDIERDDEAGRLFELAEAEPAHLPLVLVPDGEPLRNPHDAGAGRGPRAAHPGRAAAVRPVHRRRRAGRTRGRGLRRLRRPAHRRGRT